MPDEASSSPHRRQALIRLAVLAVTLLCAWRLGSLIQRYAVNVVFWDQWDFYQPMFDQAGWWALFTEQHGPHYQGLGNWVIAVTSALSGWDNVVDCWVIFAALLLCVFGMVGLRYRLTGRNDLTDLLYPVLILNTIQHHVFLATPNIAHGVLPLLILIGFAWTWRIHADLTREAIQAVLLFFAAFTGFAFILFLVSPLFLLLYVYQRWDGRLHRGWILAAGIAVTAVLFTRNYGWGQTAGLPTAIENPTPGQYLHFFTNLLARISGFHPVDSPGLRILGGLVCVVALGIVGCLLVSSRKRGRTQVDAAAGLAVLSLLVAGLATAASITYGRINGGLMPSLASRYIPLVLPVWLGIVLGAQWLLRDQFRLRYALLIVLLAFMVWRTLPLYPWQQRDIRMLHDWKSQWKEAYLETGSIEEATRAAGRPIYPHPERTQLEAKLDFLQARQLSLFQDRSGPETAGDSSP